MRCFSLAMVATLSLSTPPAQADRFADGVIALGGLSGGTDEGFAFGDFTLGATYGPWGSELGMFGVVGRLHETYANLTYQAGDIETRLGFPRPAYDLVAASALTAVMPRQALNDIGLSRSRATYGTMFESDFLPYGASVASNFGTGRAYASLHGVPKQDATIAGFGLNQHRGEVTYALAAEAVVENDAITWNTKAQATAEVGDYSYGLGLFNPAANGLPRMAEVFATRRWTQGPTATVILRQREGGQTDLTLGVTAPLSDRFDLQLATQKPNDDRPSYSAAIALTF